MKDTEVDQSIGGDKEVAEEATDHIEVPDEDADEGDGKDKDVAAQWIIVGTPPGRKDLGFSSLKKIPPHLNAGVEPVLGKGLQNPGRSNQAGANKNENWHIMPILLIQILKSHIQSLKCRDLRAFSQVNFDIL